MRNEGLASLAPTWNSPSWAAERNPSVMGGGYLASPVAGPCTDHMWGGFPTRPGASQRRRRSFYDEQSEIRRFRSRTDKVRIAGASAWAEPHNPNSAAFLLHRRTSSQRFDGFQPRGRIAGVLFESGGYRAAEVLICLEKGSQGVSNVAEGFLQYRAL